MKVITGRLVEITDEQGTRQIMEPSEPIPPCVRIFIKGNSYHIAENSDDEVRLVNEHAELKEHLERNGQFPIIPNPKKLK